MCSFESYMNFWSKRNAVSLQSLVKKPTLYQINLNHKARKVEDWLLLERYRVAARKAHKSKTSFSFGQQRKENRIIY